MARDRFSIAGLMALVAVAARGVAGLREGTEVWASAVFSATVLLLVGAVLNAALARGPRRASWGGFALFGGPPVGGLLVGRQNLIDQRVVDRVHRGAAHDDFGDAIADRVIE